MNASYACGSSDHLMSRRTLLGGLTAGIGAAAAGGGSIHRAMAKELQKQNRRVLVLFLRGGVSQLESWDPKPKTDTGGPFRAIPTSVPGIHISELLPHTAQQMHHLALVRSINSRENNHGKGLYLMTRGHRQQPAVDHPHLGSLCSHLLGPEKNPLPGYITITPKGTGKSSNDAAFLGPKYAGVVLGDGKPPQYTTSPDGLTSESIARRDRFRRMANDQFARRRRSAATQAYTYSYEQAAQLMERRDVFDVTKEPQKYHDAYGTHDFGRHCLLARRLLENGVTYVQVDHTNYDTHFENFNFHIEQLGEFDKTFATLVDDLAQREMLSSTLLVVMAEFGRTPKINPRLGRDHWGTAWSIAMGGCGIQTEAVIGKTNKNGTSVADRQVDEGHLFHTYLQAVGLDSTEPIDVDGRPMQITNPSRSAISEVLA